ncbi:MAG: 30S ribosomal protein S7 [Gammaproteobacteria bacterium]|nr:30S ribosomal protein S7 [Gammaproteobacteria bacterium]NNJ49919.1 30S ribosomal protein S7 [Gammaproteobacteria bacterium]
MPRRREVAKREVLPDPKFGSVQITKFVNMIMRGGKKSVAETILYNALDRIGEKADGEPMDVLDKALENVSPMVEVKSRRVGGATYQVPVEVRSARRTALAMRWLIEASRKRGEKSMQLKLAGELMDAAENRGNAVKKREDTHRMAEANKAFAHFRW